MRIKEQLAYAAGIVDGEGSICISRVASSYQASMTVRMTGERPVRSLAGLLPGTFTANGSTWTFRAASDNAAVCCARLLPYLCGKRRQAELVINFSQCAKAQGQRVYPEWLRRTKDSFYERLIEFHQPNLTDHEDLSSPSLNLAYLAGLVDGEGWIGIGKSGRGHSTMMTMEMTDLAPVARFARVFGGNLRTEVRRTKTGKAVYRCRIERKRALLACKAMLAHLKLKRQQAELLIRYANNVALWERRLGRGNEKRTPMEVIAKRHRWIECMRTLNRCAGAETNPEQSHNAISDSPIYEDGKLVERNRNDCALAIS